MVEGARRALVTGASSGIGREFCVQLAKRGYTVVGVARREENLQELIKELPAGEHTYLVADLATTEGQQVVQHELSSNHYHLMVNNAGFSTFDPFYESKLGDQQNILAVNCAAVMTLAHTFLQHAKAGDSLINLGSIVSFLPTPVQPMYSASKAFIASLSECLWVEHRERDIYVMGLCPGVTQTEFIIGATGGEADGQTLPAIFIQSTEQVVTEALAALDKRKKAIVVTGWVNKLMMLMPRFMTGHRLIKTLAVIGDPDNAM